MCLWCRVLKPANLRRGLNQNMRHNMPACGCKPQASALVLIFAFHIAQTKSSQSRSYGSTQRAKHTPHHPIGGGGGGLACDMAKLFSAARAVISALNNQTLIIHTEHAHKGISDVYSSRKGARSICSGAIVYNVTNSKHVSCSEFRYDII